MPPIGRAIPEISTYKRLSISETIFYSTYEIAPRHRIAADDFISAVGDVPCCGSEDQFTHTLQVKAFGEFYVQSIP
jgi:hypothetical protein